MQHVAKASHYENLEGEDYILPPLNERNQKEGEMKK